MEKETTYRKVAETRYTFTEDDIKHALLAQYVELDPGRAVKFWIIQPPYGDTEYCARLIVERTVAVDDAVMHLTQNKTVVGG